MSGGGGGGVLALRLETAAPALWCACLGLVRDTGYSRAMAKTLYKGAIWLISYGILIGGLLVFVHGVLPPAHMVIAG